MRQISSHRGFVDEKNFDLGNLDNLAAIFRGDGFSLKSMDRLKMQFPCSHFGLVKKT
jgi:hypothetical protein